MVSRWQLVCGGFMVCLATAPTLFAQAPRTVVVPFQNKPDTAQAFPNYAQHLVDQELRRHPDVLVIAFHAVVPGEVINRVIAIDAAQWDKFQWRPSDAIDTDIPHSGKTIVQVIPATHRMEVHMPLHTRDGHTIATLVCVWNFKNEEEAPTLMHQSQRIRDEIAPQINSVPQLLATP